MVLLYLAGSAHSKNFINSGINKVTLFKATAHGLARGAIQSAQGGSFKAGFLSGFSSGVDVGTQGYGGFVGRTVISGIVGGTASAMGGGKFSNGAMSGAFTHMFNAEGGGSSIVDGISKVVSYGVNIIQFAAGAALTYTTGGIGGILGVPMMAHAANNLYETAYDKSGWLRSQEESLGLNYNAVDIGVSVVSGGAGATKQIGSRVVNYGSNAITGYAPIRNYTTLKSQVLDIGVTSAGVGNTVYGMNRE